MIAAIFALLSCQTAALAAESADTTVEVDVLVIIGQSNADGSAFADSLEDSRMSRWYRSPANSHRMKIWYRSSKVENQPANALGEHARWAVDGDTVDAGPGWLDLWYRNENALGRTAMNMIHSYGTYSTGSGSDCAQGRRGIEGELGMRYATAFPDRELYVIKLGVSGSHISSWADSIDDHNWQYFMQQIFTPAIESLQAAGRRPHPVGVWWMQGCGDSNKTELYYRQHLLTLIDRIRMQPGFADVPFYIGHIIAPGESTYCPEGSKGYSDAVRQAQDRVAATTAGVETIDTSLCPMQYEPAFSGYIHFSHRGVNEIGRILAEKIISYIKSTNIDTTHDENP